MERNKEELTPKKKCTGRLLIFETTRNTAAKEKEMQEEKENGNFSKHPLELAHITCCSKPSKRFSKSVRSFCKCGGTLTPRLLARADEGVGDA